MITSKELKLKKDFLAAMTESFAAYNKHGSRSNKKLYPAPATLPILCKIHWGDTYSVKSLGIGDNKEKKVVGKYYDKKVDIAVIKKEKILAVTSFKFVTSNYAQNNINYFEQLMEETANIRRIIVDLHILRYYEKTCHILDTAGMLKKWKKSPNINYLRKV